MLCVFGMVLVGSAAGIFLENEFSFYDVLSPVVLVSRGVRDPRPSAFSRDKELRLKHSNNN